MQAGYRDRNHFRNQPGNGRFYNGAGYVGRPKRICWCCYEHKKGLAAVSSRSGRCDNFINRGSCYGCRSYADGKYPKGTLVKLLVQPDDLEHDDTSKLKLEIIDRKFRGTNFIYTLKTKNNDLIPVFVHSHHIHQHEVKEKFGIKTPIFIDHLVCF